MAVQEHVILVNPEGGLSRTGIMLTSNVALTAAHNVGAVGSAAALVRKRAKDHTRRGIVRWRDREQHFALLETASPFADIRPIRYQFLTPEHQGASVYGFPDGLIHNGSVRFDTILGHVDKYTGAFGGHVMLKFNAPIRDLERYHGLSGSPVFSANDSLLGIVQAVESQGLNLTPISHLINDDEARKLLPVDHDEHLFCVMPLDINGSHNPEVLLLNSPTFDVGSGMLWTYETAVAQGKVLNRVARTMEVLQELASNHQCLLYGDPRSGKTTLALQVMRHELSRRPSRYITLTGETSPELFQRIFGLNDRSLLIVDEAERNTSLAMWILERRGREDNGEADILMIANRKAESSGYDTGENLFHQTECVAATFSRGEAKALAAQLQCDVVVVDPGFQQLAAFVGQRAVGGSVHDMMKQRLAEQHQLRRVTNTSLEICAVLATLGLEIDTDSEAIPGLEHLERSGFLRRSAHNTDRLVGFSRAALALWLPGRDVSEGHIISYMSAHPERIAEICQGLTATAKRDWLIHVVKNAGTLLKEFLERPTLRVEEALAVLDVCASTSEPVTEARLTNIELGHLLRMADIHQARRLLHLTVKYAPERLDEPGLRDLCKVVLVGMIHQLPPDRLDDARGLLDALSPDTALVQTIENELIMCFGIEHRIATLEAGPKFIGLARLLSAFRVQRRDIASDFIHAVDATLFAETWFMTRSPLVCCSFINALSYINRRIAIGFIYEIMKDSRREKFHKWAQETCEIYQDIHHITQLVNAIRTLGARVGYHFAERMLEPVKRIVARESRLSALGYAVKGFGLASMGASKALFEVIWSAPRTMKLVDNEASLAHLGMTIQSFAAVSREAVWGHIEQRWTPNYCSKQIKKSGAVRDIVGLVRAMIAVAGDQAEEFILSRVFAGHTGDVRAVR
jgi:hypothetical protein